MVILQNRILMIIFGNKNGAPAPQKGALSTPRFYYTYFLKAFFGNTNNFPTSGEVILKHNFLTYGICKVVKIVDIAFNCFLVNVFGRED